MVQNNIEATRGTNRANVIKFLPYWQTRLKHMGIEHVSMELNTGKTIILTRKDRMGLLRALGLR